MGRLKRYTLSSSSGSDNEEDYDEKKANPNDDKAPLTPTKPPRTPRRRLRKGGSLSSSPSRSEEEVGPQQATTVQAPPSTARSTTTPQPSSDKKRRRRRLKKGASSSSDSDHDDDGDQGDDRKVGKVLNLTGEGRGATSSSQRSDATTQEDPERSDKKPAMRRTVKRPMEEEEEHEFMPVSVESPEDARAKMEKLSQKRKRRKGEWYEELFDGGGGSGGGAQRHREEGEDDDMWIYEADEEDDDFIADEGEVEEEQVVACKCGADQDDGEEDVLWLQCSNPCCATWHHGRCYGIALVEDVPKRFQCEKCDPEGISRGKFNGRPPLTPDQEKKAKKRRRMLQYETIPSLELYDLLGEEEWGVDGDSAKRFTSLLRRVGARKANQPVGEFAKRRVTLLMRAAECGRVSAVKTLLDDRGVDPLQVDKRKRSVLMYAASAGEDLEVLKMVASAVEQHGKAALRKGLTAVDSDEYNILHLAASTSTTSTGFTCVWQLFERASVPPKKVTQMLEERVGEDEFTPLMLAIEAENREGILSLIDKHPGALTVPSLSGMTPLMLAISKCVDENTKLILSHLSPEAPLQTDDEQMVRNRRINHHML